MLSTDGWRISFDERYPIYRQIINRFSYSLVRGEISPGDRIPSIRDMSVLLKVNTNTVQRAYQEMERDNLIYSQRGTGYFVMQDENMIDRVKETMVQESTATFLNEMRALGYSGEQIIQELRRQLGKEGEQHGANDHQ